MWTRWVGPLQYKACIVLPWSGCGGPRFEWGSMDVAGVWGVETLLEGLVRSNGMEGVLDTPVQVYVAHSKGPCSQVYVAHSQEPCSAWARGIGQGVPPTLSHTRECHASEAALAHQIAPQRMLCDFLKNVR